MASADADEWSSRKSRSGEGGGGGSMLARRMRDWRLPERRRSLMRPGDGCYAYHHRRRHSAPLPVVSGFGRGRRAVFPRSSAAAAAEEPLAGQKLEH